MIKNPALGPALQGKTGSNFFAEFLPSLVGLVLLGGSLIFFFVFLMGAIQWITSGGDKQALEGARAKITNGIIGVVLLFIAFAVIGLIETFFKINILTIDIGPLIIK
jgi:hypothetical protein